MRRSGHLLILGLGYSATTVAQHAVAAGYAVTATTRDLARPVPRGVSVIRPEQAATVLPSATHWLAGAPPGEGGDPFLDLLGEALEASAPDWIGYFSTTGVYGDRNGEWVDETTAPAPSTARGQRRVAAESAWSALAARLGARMDLLRLAGIYGPGRSVFDALRNGTSRRIVAPGHEFGRIHRDDIAGATLAAMREGPGHRICNLVDDVPAESADVIAYAASLLGVAAPLEVPLEDALETMSPMGRSFWSEHRKVSGRATQAALKRQWRYPSYKEGLAATLLEEKLLTRS